jgi:hypothetical protein
MEADAGGGQHAGLDLLVGDRVLPLRRAKTVSSCARASSTVRPSASRPFTNSQRWPRFWIRVGPGSLSFTLWTPPKLRRSTIIAGTQNSGWMPGTRPEKPAGATPTTV